MSRSEPARAEAQRPPTDRLQPRRLAIIGVLTGLSFAIVALLTVVVGAGASPEGEFDQEFLAACRRSDAPQPRCRCALAEWNATVDADGRNRLDSALVEDAELPEELRAALARC